MTAPQPNPGRWYVGRHRPGPYRDRDGRRVVPDPVDPAYSPLAPATRQVLAPTHWADRPLHATPAEMTGLMPRITDNTTDLEDR